MIVATLTSEFPIAIMGLGKTGLSAAKSLRAGGIEIWAWDDSAQCRREAQLEGVNLVDLYSCDWKRLRLLVLSPGIPDVNPQPHPIASKALAEGCEIICDIDLLARSNSTSKFAGITGTNGKSTTVALIGHILTKAGYSNAVGGNFGVPALDLKTLSGSGTYVLELSSYQMSRIPSLELDIAAITNISPDHLDRHGGMAGYVSAKKEILDHIKTDGKLIIGVDDQYCRSISLDVMVNGPIKSQNIIPTSVKARVAGGVYIDGSILIDHSNNEKIPILDLAQITSIPGVHNWQNIAVAAAVATACGVAHEKIADGILSFVGLPHRLELIRIIGEVFYINDSKATNFDAAQKALACYNNIYWIVGGELKSGNAHDFFEISDHVGRAYVIGQDAGSIASKIQSQVVTTISGTLENAVVQAHGDAQKNGEPAVVLLSPACLSLDQFDSFESRGDCFRNLVEQLP